MSTPNPDPIAIANLAVSSITAIAALFIAFLALQQSAKPKIKLVMCGSKKYRAGMENRFRFEVINVGHWFGSPPALDIAAYCKFDPEFKLVETRYGSTQEQVNTNMRSSREGFNYIRAKNLKLSRRGEREEFHVIAVTPAEPGKYRIEASAFSAEGVSCECAFLVDVVTGT